MVDLQATRLKIRSEDRVKLIVAKLFERAASLTCIEDSTAKWNKRI